MVKIECSTEGKAQHRFKQWHNDIFRFFSLMISKLFCLLECEYMSKSNHIWPFVCI